MHYIVIPQQDVCKNSKRLLNDEHFWSVKATLNRWVFTIYIYIYIYIYIFFLFKRWHTLIKHHPNMAAVPMPIIKPNAIEDGKGFYDVETTVEKCKTSRRNVDSDTCIWTIGNMPNNRCVNISDSNYYLFNMLAISGACSWHVMNTFQMFIAR